MSLLVHIIMTYIKENYTAHPEILGQAVNHLRCLWENLFARAVYRPHSKYSLKGLDYREWKKLESPDFLEECKRQKENYMKTSILLKKRITREKNCSKREGTAFAWLQESPLRTNSKWNELCLFLNQSWYWPFPKREETSRKQKRQVMTDCTKR